jgi:hypothetical protein
MRKVIVAFFIFLLSAMAAEQPALASNPTASDIFGAIGGTTTIDQGGAIHSQARSIYSLGGGMVSFQGKHVSLLDADPPSFSAGCNGISWHFGGFAFISMDEIRQLVEAVAQASLGVAVDLAMHTLCPQCYAVMSKLRDISNMMRNAAADACHIATDLGNKLLDGMGFSATSSSSSCATGNSEQGSTSSLLEGWAGSACSLLSDANTWLTTQSNNITNWLNGNKSGTTPSKNQFDGKGNITYQALTALGYPDGPSKDILLSVLGMAIVPLSPQADCKSTLANVTVQAVSSTGTSAVDKTTAPTDPGTVNGTNASAGQSNAANAPSGGDTKGGVVCYAPPIIDGLTVVARTLMCGANPDAEMQAFANAYYPQGGVAAVKNSSVGAMCAPTQNAEAKDPPVYDCQATNPSESKVGVCLNPTTVPLSSVQPSSSGYNGFTGLAWMIEAALLDGTKAVMNNTTLPPQTVAILNGSQWPLYRLINMAAVYPGMATDLISAYSSAIAAQYVMDTLDQVTRIGAGTPSINLQATGTLNISTVSSIREQIMDMVRDGDDVRTKVLARLAEKQKLVDTVVQVNKALQAEVIGQGLAGNTSLALSIKKQASSPNYPQSR